MVIKDEYLYNMLQKYSDKRTVAQKDADLMRERYEKSREFKFRTRPRGYLTSHYND